MSVGKRIVSRWGPRRLQTGGIVPIAGMGRMAGIASALLLFGAAFSFTHDGNYLYFIKGEKNGRGSLYRMPALGGVARKILENVSSRVALSADDQRIAFIRGGFSANENSLVVANSDGSGERLIATHYWIALPLAAVGIDAALRLAGRFLRTRQVAFSAIIAAPQASATAP